MRFQTLIPAESEEWDRYSHRISGFGMRLHSSVGMGQQPALLLLLFLLTNLLLLSILHLCVCSILFSTLHYCPSSILFPTHMYVKLTSLCVRMCVRVSMWINECLYASPFVCVGEHSVSLSRQCICARAHKHRRDKFTECAFIKLSAHLEKLSRGSLRHQSYRHISPLKKLYVGGFLLRRILLLRH